MLFVCCLAGLANYFHFIFLFFLFFKIGLLLLLLLCLVLMLLLFLFGLSFVSFFYFVTMLLLLQTVVSLAAMCNSRAVPVSHIMHVCIASSVAVNLVDWLGVVSYEFMNSMICYLGVADNQFPCD